GGTAKQAFTVVATAGIGRFAPVADRLPLPASLPETTPIVTAGAIFASSARLCASATGPAWLLMARCPSLSSVPSLENMNSSASITLDLPLPFGAKIARQRFLLKSNVLGWRYARNPERPKDWRK